MLPQAGKDGLSWLGYLLQCPQGGLDLTLQELRLLGVDVNPPLRQCERLTLFGPNLVQSQFHAIPAMSPPCDPPIQPRDPQASLLLLQEAAFFASPKPESPYGSSLH